MSNVSIQSQDLRLTTPEEVTKFTVEAIQELSGFGLQLTDDPTGPGLVVLSSSMAKARMAYERAAYLMSLAIWSRDQAKRFRNGTKQSLELARARALSDDEKVQKGRDAASRAALADLSCGAEREAYDLAVELYDVTDAAVNTIEVWWRSIRDYRDDLNFQLNVVRQRVEIGEIDIPQRGGYNASWNPVVSVPEAMDDTVLEEYGMDKGSTKGVLEI